MPHEASAPAAEAVGPTLTRLYDAPREMVFRAWTEPEPGPHGLPSPAELSRDLVFVRRFGAPRAAVFRAWTDPAALARWWGPRGSTNPLCELDARPGGRLRIHMIARNGTVFPCRGEVREMRAPEHLVFTSSAEFAGSAMLELCNVVQLEEEAGGTRLCLVSRILRAAPITLAMHSRGMERLWGQSLDRLAENLEIRA